MPSVHETTHQDSDANVQDVPAVNKLALGEGRPSRQELELCLVSHNVGGDWNFHLARVSFDFRSVEGRDGVYLRGLSGRMLIGQ